MLAITINIDVQGPVLAKKLTTVLSYGVQLNHPHARMLCILLIKDKIRFYGLLKLHQAIFF